MSSESDLERELSEMNEKARSDWKSKDFDAVDPLDPPEVLPPESSEPEEQFNDILSVTIRNGTRGIGLYSVLAISVCMALVSFAMMAGYEVPASPVDPSGYDSIESTCSNPTSRPLWADLMQLQIQVIQNLIHASLLGGAALAAALRGDAWFLFFARNCALYFGLPAVSYLVLSIFNRKSDFASTWEVILFSLFTIFCLVAFIRLDSVSRSLRPMAQCTNSVPGMPQGTARSPYEARKANAIYYSAIAVQLVSVLYAIVTTALALPTGNNSDSLLPSDETGHGRLLNGSETKSSGSLLAFESSYSLGAHEAFLLTLFLLCSTYPGCPACYGGAILGSAWRFLLSLCSVSHLLFHFTALEPSRAMLSLLFTCLEGMSVVPILVSASLLARNDMSNGKRDSISYHPVDTDDFKDEAEEGEGSNMSPTSDSVMAFTSCSLEKSDGKMNCPTLAQIGSSPRYSRKKRVGAILLWRSSISLFVGMTLECVLLLTTIMLGSDDAHEIYKWGMHVCAMYLFCCIMNVASPEVYSLARLLLFLACPAGSAIGGWQLWTLVSSSDLDSSLVNFAACLFGIRAFSGAAQTLGLIMLTDTQIEHDMTKAKSSDEDSGFLESNMTNLPSDIERAVCFGRVILLKVYVPAVCLYTAASTLKGNCFEPMISPSTLKDSSADSFIFAPNWPGIGLAFHFGLLLVVFASDGLTEAIPSYPPSLAIASLFAGQVAFLLASHLLYDAVGRHGFGRQLSTLDWIQRVTLVLWMVSAGYLSYRLHRVRILKTIS